MKLLKLAYNLIAVPVGVIVFAAGTWFVAAASIHAFVAPSSQYELDIREAFQASCVQQDGEVLIQENLYYSCRKSDGAVVPHHRTRASISEIFWSPKIMQFVRGKLPEIVL